MTQALRYLAETPSQTAGPYVHIGLAPAMAGLEHAPSALGEAIAGPEITGERITVQGTITDGTGALVTDALVEMWQADAEGRYGRNGSFIGWGRAAADFETGIWRLETIRPGALDPMAPHLALWIAARGINTGLHTRIYFPEDAERHSTDPVLVRTPRGRRDTLIANPTGPGAYRFDIHLQGENETVFLDI